MSEQQYRVIADRDVEPEDRYTSIKSDGPYPDPLMRIERPVPTTEEPTCDCGAPLAVCTAAFRGTGPSMSLPTREQIAEVIGKAWRSPRPNRWNHDAADAVLALLQKASDR